MGADNLALAELEVGDGLLGLGKNGLLAGDGGEVAGDVGDLVLVSFGINAAVQHDLADLGHFVQIFVATTLDERRCDLLNVELFKGWDVFAAHYGKSRRITDPATI